MLTMRRMRGWGCDGGHPFLNRLRGGTEMMDTSSSGNMRKTTPRGRVWCLGRVDRDGRTTTRRTVERCFVLAHLSLFASVLARSPWM